MRVRPTSTKLGVVALAASSAAAVTVACSSSVPSTPVTKPPPGFVASDAQPEAASTTDNCVAIGTSSNGLGVGGYCTPGGGECRQASADAAVPLCTADLSAPAGAWFCTITCATAADCGPGATCVTAIQGEACVPDACLAVAGEILVSDAGDGVDASEIEEDGG